MYFRHILRTQLIGTRAAHLNRLHRVRGAEVTLAALKLAVLINVLFLLTSAERVDNSRPRSSGGGCGEPAELHHQEVWTSVPLSGCSVCKLAAVFSFRVWKGTPDWPKH